MSHTTTGAVPKETKTFFGHPRMLANLFTVEMWERFSFYGMQGIMIYYLYYTADKGGLGLDKDMATGVIGAYGAVVYLMTILGGILGDRLLGPGRRNAPFSTPQPALWPATFPSPSSLACRASSSASCWLRLVPAV